MLCFDAAYGFHDTFCTPAWQNLLLQSTGLLAKELGVLSLGLTSVCQCWDAGPLHSLYIIWTLPRLEDLGITDPLSCSVLGGSPLEHLEERASAAPSQQQERLQDLYTLNPKPKH